MALGPLLALVTVGIAFVMLVTHLLGGSTVPRLDENRAREAFLAEHPSLVIDHVRVDVTGRTAVVFLANGQLAVVVGLGDHLAVKVVLSEHVVMHDENRLTVRFDDVGWPTRTVELPNPDRDQPRSTDVRE